MKGIIFREFLEMVENKFGYEIVDQIITDSNLPNNGAYSSVGTYPHSEMFSLVANLSKHTGIEIPALLEAYGKHAFGVFAVAYPHVFKEYHDAFSFLSGVEGTIHVEVKKLYPEAELPTLVVNEMDDRKMVLIYRSQRKMGFFAKGLIMGCFEHFNEKATITMQPINDEASEVEFVFIKE